MTPSTEDDVDRARRLRETAETEPEAVDVDDVVDRLVLGDRETRRLAFEAYEELAERRPATVDAAATRLEHHLTAEDAKVRRRGALATGTLVERRSEGFTRLIPALRSIGDNPAEPGREPAVVALSKLAIERPADATAAVDTLLEMCHDRVVGPDDSGPPSDLSDPGASGDPALRQERERRDEVRVHAVAGLTRIAAADPDAVREAVPDVVDLLEDDHHLVRAAACEVLEAVAREFPADVAPFAADLATRVASDPNHPVPWRAADALVAVGEAHPERVGDAVAPVVDDLSPFLESGDDDRRRDGVALLAHAARARPGGIEPAIPTLLDLLEDDVPAVRENAALALGFGGADGIRDALSDLADGDPDAAVRDAARRSLERIGAGPADER